MKKRFEIGDFVLVWKKKPAVVDDYDKEDNTYRVSFNPVDFDWVDPEDLSNNQPKRKEKK